VAGDRPAATLVGRSRERRVLERLVTDVVAGSSRVLVLRGEAGVGRSALLGALAERVAGWRVVRAAGVEAEAGLAHGGLHQLCTPLLGSLPALPLPQREALTTALGLAPGPAPEEFLLAVATLSLVGAAAGPGPLACLVDDVQWLDRASAQALAFVARRLRGERVALVCAARSGSGDGVLAGLPALPVHGLAPPDARALLLGALRAPLDPAVTDRVVAESRGNPRSLLALPRTWTPAELAGGFGVPAGREVADASARRQLRRLALLPADTRLLVLTAAAEPLGDPALLRRAAQTLGVDMAASAPAMDAGLLEVAGRVRFSSPLLRPAVHAAASVGDRRRVHRALADACDAGQDPDRRAWHRAAAGWGPDEAVAAALEASAERARTRGGLPAAAAFLARAAEATPAPGVRAARAVEAASAALQAGSPDTASDLLALADLGPLDELQRGRADLVRARLVLLSDGGGQAAPLLVTAARRLERLDPPLAREAHLDACAAARSAAHLADGGAAGPAALDPLAAALAALSGGSPGGVPLGRAVLARLRADTAPGGGDLRGDRWACLLALELWDDDAAHLLAHRHLRAAREAGALGELAPAAESVVPALVLCGETAVAAAALAEAAEVHGRAGVTAGALVLDAWRGEETRTREPAAGVDRAVDAVVGGYARAVLCAGLGRHDEAYTAARAACSGPHRLAASTWALAELVESAAHTGRADVAREAHRRLAARALAGGTGWALGVEARARALLAEGGDAEEAFRAAVGHLAGTRVRAEHARTRLLYGEWLRRADRRADAREELAAAHRAFSGTGMRGFAERARRELAATGATVRPRAGDGHHALTAREADIARLAREGMSNPDIGARLFLSARTVEWHLRKVFTKLGISSRRELRWALPDGDGTGPR
jgi:DNA-binding CsgD family transcriptional regulator